MAGTILTAMKRAQLRRTNAGCYGSVVPKHAYIYGQLDLSPMIGPSTVDMA